METEGQSRAAPIRTDNPLLEPRSVAVIGASDRLGSMSGLVVSLLDRFEFPGPVYPVNPKYPTIQGHRCYPSIDEIPSDLPVDLAILYLPADLVLPTVRQCGERGVRALVLLSSGFAEIGASGADLEIELGAMARRYGMKVAGPNCAGVANFHANLVAYGTTNFADLQDIHKGGVALVSASGGLGNTLFTYCQERRVGVSHLIGLGNETVTTVAEHLESLIDDPAVSVVAGYVEAVRETERFFAAAELAVEAGKPVVLMKAGRSEAGQHSILTHTAALGGSPKAFAGAFRKHGVLQATDLDELVDAVMVLERCPAASGRNIGVYSLAGGGTSLVADIAADHGFIVPDLSDPTVAALKEALPKIAIVKNPLDPTAGFARDSQKLRSSLLSFAADPNIDIVVFFPLAAQVDYATQLAEDLVAVRDEIEKPIVCIWTAGRHLEPNAWRILHDGGVALFTSTTACFRALQMLRDFTEFKAMRSSPEVRDFGSFVGLDAPEGASTADLLGAFGVRLPTTSLATSAAEAVDAVRALGAPAVFKVASPDIPHKTEAGGVVVGVSEVDAGMAFESILASARAYAPAATLIGVEVQELVPEGVEMLVGVTTDDQLGPVVVVGMGGVLAEVLDDVAMRPAPVSRADVRAMLGELRGHRILAGVRGRPAADVDAFVDLVLGVSALAMALSDRRPEIDLNPVVVLPDGQGAVALDYLVHLS